MPLSIVLMPFVAVSLAGASLSQGSLSQQAASSSLQVPAISLFENQPTGTYRYVSLASSTAAETAASRSTTWLLRKSGAAVVGVTLTNRREQVAVQHCFRGQAEGDRLIHITSVAPPFSPDSNWESQQALDLSNLSAHATSDVEISAAEQSALETCAQLFWR